MKIKALYINLPENEYIRLKVYAITHRKNIQMTVRDALSAYFDAQKLKMSDCENEI